MRRFEDRWYVLGASLLPGLAPCLGALLAAGAQPKELFEASRTDLTARWGLSASAARETATARDKFDLGAECARVEEADAWVVSVVDEDYPQLLAQVPHPPPLLYGRGTLPDGPAVAIVGSRKASSYGLAVAEKLARELVEGGVSVVSGLALGIDFAAHRAVVEAGGATIAVLGSGIDVCYPRRHASFVPALLKSGCMVTELPMGTAPRSQHFPARNRIISGLSLATVVVEAAENSGALYTADFAIAQNREVCVVPGSIFSSTSLGTNALLADGAWPVRCADDVFDTLGLEVPDRVAARKRRLSEREAKILAAAASQPLTADELILSCGLPASDVASLLVLLEIKGFMRKGLDQRYISLP